MSDLPAMKCRSCEALLLKGEGDADIEILCTTCRTMNYPSRNTAQLVSWPMGRAFMDSTVIAHRCWHCHRLQFYSRIGKQGTYEIKCRICSNVTNYDIALMRKRKMVYPKTIESEKNRKTLAL